MADDQRFRPTGLDLTGEHPPEPPDSCPVHAGESGADNRQLAAQLARIADGDRDTFTEFYRATQHRVFGLALRVLRRRATAEEVTQEVYLQVWSLAGRYDDRLASPIGWLMMLTHRRAVDRVRSETSAAGRELTYGHRHLGRDHDIVAETVDQRADERAVADCLAVLTATQHETVALAYYGGHTYAEVARRLGIPLNTVKTRIRDGLARLRTCLTGSVTDD